MKFRKLRIAIIATCVIACVALVAVAWYVTRHVTFSSDRAWVLTATSFQLTNSDVVVAGPSLQKVLSEYNTKCNRNAGWSCSLGRRDGKILIDQKEYPAYFELDKFRGNIFVIEGRWKTIELFRNTNDPSFPSPDDLGSKNQSE